LKIPAVDMTASRPDSDGCPYHETLPPSYPAADFEMVTGSD